MTVDINAVWEHLDDANWYALAMLEGGEGAEGKYIPLEDDDLRKTIESVLVAIDEFRATGVRRLEEKSIAGIGSDVDQLFDRKFRSLVDSADAVEIQLQHAMWLQLQQYRMVENLLLLIVLIMGIILVFTFRRHELRRNKDLESLNQASVIIENSLAVLFRLRFQPVNATSKL